MPRLTPDVGPSALLYHADHLFFTLGKYFAELLHRKELKMNLGLSFMHKGLVY